MSTKGTVRTRARPLGEQDQNLSIHNKGVAAKVQTDGPKSQQNSGLGVRKALANITNSEKPSLHQESKKNQLKKLTNRETPIAIGEQQSQHHGSKSQLKPVIGARKSLANITNSENPPYLRQESKSTMKKCTSRNASLAIEEEQCQHNHQCCISLQTKTSTMNLLKAILPLDDEKSPLELWSPKSPSTLNQQKVDLVATPRHLEFTQSPLSLKVRSSISRSMDWSPLSPSMF